MHINESNTRLKKNTLLILTLIGVGTILTYAYIFADGLPIKRVCVKDICLDCEIAESSEARTQGLMFRENLEEKRGMLFVFKNTVNNTFWMKNMKFPLDIIWADENKIITDITTNASPCRDNCQDIITKTGFKYVLEANAGFVSHNKLKIGDRLEF